MSIFNSVRVTKPKFTTFDLSNKYVGNVGFGALIPFLAAEMNPGEKFRFSAEVLVESFPMLASIYGDIDVKLEYFFVPNRLLWDKWEDFITGGEDGLFSSRPPIFVDTVGDGKAGEQSLRYKLWDYLGLPLNEVDDVSHFIHYDAGNPVTLFPFNAYRRIWNEWYRNENLQDELDFFTSDVDVRDSPAMDDVNTLLYRNWRKDYFTSSLPWVQRGVSPLVQVDGLSANVTIGDKTVPLRDTGEALDIKLSDISNRPPLVDGTEYGVYTSGIYSINSEGVIGTIDNSNWSGNLDSIRATNLGRVDIGKYPSVKDRIVRITVDDQTPAGRIRVEPLSADLTGTSFQADLTGLNFDINELRRTNAVQRWLERNARAGGRYIEQIASHFGVVVPDYRLQRSEFIGGITQPVRIGQILQTDTPDGEPTLTDALGTPAGQASSGLFSGKRRYKALEHGWLMGIMSIVPRSEYYQGTPRKFTRVDRFDYYFPEFSHLGEEVVKKSEIFTFPWKELGYDDTFGYQSIYSSYKWERNYIVGDFRKSLKYWALTRDFSVDYQNASRFGLNEDFVSLGSPSNRTLRNVFSVPSNERPFRFYIKNHVKAKRPMPKYGTPRL